MISILEALRLLNEKLEFTKSNFQVFLNRFKDDINKILDISDENQKLELLVDLCEKLSVELKNSQNVDKYIDDNDLSMMLLELIIGDKSIDDFQFAYDATVINDEKSSILQIRSLPCLDLHELSNNTAITNFNTMISDLLKFDEDSVNDLLKTIRSGKSYPLSKGQISGAIKYNANAPDNLKLKDGLPVEFRINSNDSAKKRVYGIIIDNKILYLATAYNKNSGQDDADKNFDAFLRQIKDYLPNLYSNSEEFNV